MNLLEIRTSLRSRVGNPSTTDVPDATLDDIANRAYVQITDRYKFFKNRKLCYFTTVAGQQKYELPTSSLVVLSVADLTNKIELDMKDDTWGNNNQWDGTTTGRPTDYVRYRGWMQLYPVPNGSYNIQVYYKYSVDKLVIDGDTPVIPLEWHEGIVLLGRYIYWDDKGDIPKAQYAMNAYKEMWLADKPDEMDDELMATNKLGVIVPTKSPSTRRLDFDHADN